MNPDMLGGGSPAPPGGNQMGGAPMPPGGTPAPDPTLLLKMLNRKGHKGPKGKRKKPGKKKKVK
jgi:hypothetical protein